MPLVNGSSRKSRTTRQRLLDAAATTFLEKGYAGARLTDIAELAGIQTGSIYYHFDSRDQLLEALMCHGVEFTHAHVRGVVERLPDEAAAGDRLLAAMTAYLEALLQLGDLSPVHVVVYPQLPEALRSRIRPLRRSFGQFWRTLIDGAVASGEIRRDLDPRLMQFFVVELLQAGARGLRSDTGDVDDFKRSLTTLLLGGFGPEASRAE